MIKYLAFLTVVLIIILTGVLLLQYPLLLCSSPPTAHLPPPADFHDTICVDLQHIGRLYCEKDSLYKRAAHGDTLFLLRITTIEDSLDYLVDTRLH